MWSPSFSVVIFSLLFLKTFFSSQKPVPDGQLKVGNAGDYGETKRNPEIKERNDGNQVAAFADPLLSDGRKYKHEANGAGRSELDEIHKTAGGPADSIKEYGSGARKTKDDASKEDYKFIACKSFIGLEDT